MSEGTITDEQAEQYKRMYSYSFDYMEDGIVYMFRSVSDDGTIIPDLISINRAGMVSYL